VIWLALIAPVAVAATPPEVKPVATTIAAIRSNPQKFSGQVVRLTGWVNSCQSLSCAIDERPAADRKGAGQRLSIAADPRFDRTIEPLLPTYVEFDARFDAACVVGVCTDRAPVLTVVSLRSVISTEPPPFED
jgi:hypothetical protein